jgi:pimeloyl-ACP methyl ester carboxylesterase
MADGNTAFVLVPGAGLGGWIWRDVAPLLDAPAVAVDYAGDGVPRAGLDMNDYVAAVTTQAASTGANRLIVVGHSIGGLVALEAAARLGGRVAGFIGVAAAVPLAGRSFVDALPLPQRLVMRALLRVAGTKPPESAIRSGLAGGLNDEVASEVVRRFQPESRALYFTRRGASPPPVRRLYIRTKDDREFNHAMQVRMSANLGSEVVAMDGGHLPMLAQPQELADRLNAFRRAIPT